MAVGPFVDILDRNRKFDLYILSCYIRTMQCWIMDTSHLFALVISVFCSENGLFGYILYLLARNLYVFFIIYTCV